jgi:hypothetical protein
MLPGRTPNHLRVYFPHLVAFFETSYLTHKMPHLLSLPPELIIMICHFCSTGDLLSWALADLPRLDLVLDELYSLNAYHDRASALF